MAAAVALLLLVVLLSAVSHHPSAACCFILIPVFLFALVELPPSETADQPDHARGFEGVSPWLFQRPPPLLV
jgi:hypothetical protein